MITLEQFKELDIRIGEILAAEKVPETDKLLRLTVLMGDEAPRQIISGIAAYYPDPAELVGAKCAFVANLEPRTIKGLESQGMILAATTPEGHFALLTPSREIPAGARLR